jgi:chloramphenicol 3-O-phosphotransferase
MAIDFTLPRIILITGIMAAGKSTVAQALAERLPKSVHLRGDVFRRMIVSGRAEMGTDYGDEAYQQLLLRYRLAVTAVAQYVEVGFTVVYQDVIIGQDLGDVVAMIHAASLHFPLHVIVLSPSPEVAAARDQAREKTGYGDWTAEMLHQSFITETPQVGLWLDNSTQTVDETVDAILARLEEAVL